MDGSLQLDGVSRTFPGLVPVSALQATSCRVEPGESVAIVGPSGSGKSTLLNLLGLLDRPSSGRYRIGGVESTSLTEQRRTALRASVFGFVFQAFHLLDDRDVVRNVELGMLYSGVPATTRRARAVDAVERVGLGHRASARPATLSGGERQRVAIARAIAAEPPVLLCDEPSGNLDSRNAQAVLDLLTELNADGVTLVVVTHDEHVASRLARRFSVRDGLVTEVSQPSFSSAAPSSTAPAPVLTPPLAAISIKAPPSAPLTSPLKKAELDHPLPFSQPTVSDARLSRRKRLEHSPVLASRLAFGDLLDELALSIMHKPARSVLTVLGTVLGVATLVCTLGLTATASAQVSARFDALEATKVVVKDSTPAAASPPFEATGLDAVRHRAGVVAAGESFTLDAQVAVRASDRTDPLRPAPKLTVTALGPETLDAVDAVVGSGRSFTAVDVRLGLPLVLVGRGAAAELGLGVPKPEQVLVVGGQRLVIAGVVTAAPRRPELLSGVLVVPSVGSYLAARLASPPQHELVVKVRPGAAQAVGQALPLLLSATNPARFQVEVPPSADSFRAQVQGDLSSVFLILAAVALAVGVLGIANSALVAVMQRTREFGVRRALGARARHVAFHVLGESAVLGLVGGLAGLTLGLVVVVLTAAVKGWTPALDPVVTSVAPALGLVTGLLAGLYPAFRASRIEPVDALRAE